MQNNIFQETATLLGVKIVEITEGDEYCKLHGESAYKNNSWHLGHEIHLGIWDDPNLKLASLFQMVGYSLVTDKFKKSVGYNMGKIKGKAFQIGFELANSYNIHFDDYVFKWADGMTKKIEQEIEQGWKKSKERRRAILMLILAILFSMIFAYIVVYIFPHNWHEYFEMLFKPQSLKK